MSLIPLEIGHNGYFSFFLSNGMLFELSKVITKTKRYEF